MDGTATSENNNSYYEKKRGMHCTSASPEFMVKNK
jgi:hypothetical protein